MTLEIDDTIDIVSVDHDTTLVLNITVTEDWTGSNDQLRRLQAKVSNYVQYVVGGQRGRDFPQYADFPVRVVMNVFAEPSASLLEVYGMIAGHLRMYGMDFGSTVVPHP